MTSFKLFIFRLFFSSAILDLKDIQMRNIIGTVIIESLAGFIFAPIFYIVGHTQGALIILAGTLIISSIPYIIYKTNNTAHIQYFPALYMYFIMVTLAYTQDGIESTSLAWFVAVPTISLMISSIKASLIWAIVSALTIFTFYIISLLNISLPINPLSQENMILLSTLGTVGLIFYILSFGIATQMMKDNALEQLYKIAGEDLLTQLYTRRRFFEKVDTILDKNVIQSISIVMIDIDNFKAVNDTYGHSVGDQVLIDFAKICRGILNEEDIFARFGGEEFILFSNGKKIEDIMKIAEDLRVGIEKNLFIKEDETHPLTISLGVSYVDNIGTNNIDNLILNADIALYTAKKSNKNRVVLNTVQ